MDTRSVIAAACGVCALVAGIWWASIPADRAVEPPADRAVEPPADRAVEPPADRAVEPPADRAVEPPADRAVEPPADRAVEPPADRAVEPPADRAVEPPADLVVQKREAGDRTSHPEDADAGRGSRWDDPTNDRVLGRKEWIAPVDQEERARIDEVFEKARAARYDPRLPDRSRTESIEVVTVVVDRCFEALVERVPSASGRLIIAWEAGAKDGVGTIEDPRIKVNYKLEDDQFEACILDGMRGLTFRGADGDPITIEVPFFYDGAY